MTDDRVNQIIKVVDSALTGYHRYQQEHDKNCLYCAFPRVEITNRDWLNNGRPFVVEYLRSESDYFIVDSTSTYLEAERSATGALNRYPVAHKIKWATPLEHQKNKSMQEVFPGFKETVAKDK